MRAEPAPRGPLASPGFWLHHAALTYRRVVEQRLEAIGITYSQFNLLTAVSWLSRHGQQPTQQQAAAFARTDRMMTSKLVQTLEQRGYLARHSDRADARLRRLELTSLGRAAVHAAVQAAQAVDGELFTTTGPGLRDALRAIAEQTWEDVRDG